ncbi:ABC transporter ATP-binding protein [Limoniibacter endophyticus]|uniref:Spermidine/putrescine import ATP-binding protein PotA n=1 Tax=Limoniibacter endophyticus TaxID=1565040 RepID=A0A8J3DKI6_9HYPH|nr:ABC transporter ATP-binding protein [Limoniibacter endophyticus]GHC77845.1 polyamine-transporting ATPase [Limoniibacter endophyticus]
MNDFRIRFDGVSKNFGALRVVDRLNLDIKAGEFVSLLGPSGSGKTTLLMMLAGFEEPTEGRILVDGTSVNGLPSYKRNMGVVFQNYALFPHMTVAENVAFPLSMRNFGKGEIRSRVDKALDMVQLGTLSRRYPAQLSGGQQQRVALARALVFEPRVVLMDEPLGALDKQLREQMQLDIRELHNRLGLTIVFVTHDQSEALTMSDRIAVFNKGKIEQIGSPRDIYDHPRTRFVAEFIGETNLTPGRILEVGADTSRVELADGRIVQAAPAHVRTGDEVLVSIRPERVQIGDNASGINVAKATIRDSIYQGDHLRLLLDLGTTALLARLDRRSREWKIGDTVSACFAPADCWIIPRQKAEV